MSQLIALDRWILLVVNGTLGVEASGSAFVVVSHLGDWAAVWLAVCAVVLWVERGDERAHRTVVLALAALLASEAAVAALKVTVARPRPAEVIPHLQSLPVVAGGFSFPSAHAARSFAAAGVLASHLTRDRWLLWSLAGLIALSRVVIGVHYPLDVIFGALLGGAVAWLLLRANAFWRPAGERAEV